MVDLNSFSQWKDWCIQNPELEQTYCHARTRIPLLAAKSDTSPSIYKLYFPFQFRYPDTCFILEMYAAIQDRDISISVFVFSFYGRNWNLTFTWLVSKWLQPLLFELNVYLKSLHFLTCCVRPTRLIEFPNICWSNMKIEIELWGWKTTIQLCLNMLTFFLLTFSTRYARERYR